MRKTNIDYAQLADGEWVKLLVSAPVDEDAYRYFFEVKCRPMLLYIANSIFGNSETETLLGELYIFLSDNDWYVIRQFKSLNGASLNSYLSRCVVRFFMKKKRASDSLMHNTVSMEHPDICSELGRFTVEEQGDNPPVWLAYEHLKERDKVILRNLIIEGKSALEAADEIWPYVKATEKEWRKLPVKRVQDTLAMLKRRALLALTVELQRMLG